MSVMTGIKPKKWICGSGCGETITSDPDIEDMNDHFNVVGAAVSGSRPMPIRESRWLAVMKPNSAEITGVTYSVKKGSTTVRKWKMEDPDSKDYRQIPYSPWRLMIFHAGVISCDELKLI